MRQIKSTNELRRFKRYILPKGVIIGDLTQLIRLDDFLVIFDRLQAKIYKFDLEGNFVQEIGRSGQGPGEFEKPFYIKKAFDQNIAILDGFRGQIIVLDLNGRLISNYALHTTQGMIIPGSNFIWSKPSQLILGAFVSDKDSGPWHVILKHSDGKFDIVNGFGERFEPFAARRLGTVAVSVFEEVGENIWVGSPYSVQINVYSSDGKFLHEIGSKSRINGVEKAYFDSIPTDREKARKYRGKLMELEAPRRLTSIGDLVLVAYHETLCLFDRNGNIIKDNIPRNGMAPILESFDNEIYSPHIVTEGDMDLAQEEREYLMGHLKIDISRADDLNPLIKVETFEYE